MVPSYFLAHLSPLPLESLQAGGIRYPQPMHPQPGISPHNGGVHSATDISTGNMRVLMDHFDRVLASSQHVLLERISKQDGILSKQQKLLDSLIKLDSARRSESAKDHETLRIDVSDVGKKTDQLTRRIRDAMTLLATGTMEAINDCQSSIEKRLLYVQETCDGIKKEMKDPQANIDARVHHDVAIGSNSPVRGTSHYDDAIASPSPSEPSVPLYDRPCENIQDDNDRSNFDLGQNSAFVTETNAPQPLEPDADGQDAPEPVLLSRQPSYEAVEPMDMPDVPNSPRSSSPHMDSKIDTKDHQQRSSSAFESDGSTTPPPNELSILLHSKVTWGNHHLPDSTLVSQADSSPRDETTSVRVLATILPDQVDFHEEQPASKRPSASPLDSLLGSPPASTISLPDPITFINEYFNQPEEAEPPLTAAPSDTFKIRPSMVSLSSLSSLSSEDFQKPRTPDRSSCGIKPKGGGTGSSATPKRRRSSPGSSRCIAAKRPRNSGQSGLSRKFKKKLIAEHFHSSPRGRKRSARSSCASWPRLSTDTPKDGTNRQFIQCDKCELWYHWGCVGIRDNDTRLHDGKVFACPPCRGNKKKAVLPSLTKEGLSDICSRPDCGFNGQSVEEFFIEKIIGRSVNTQDGNRILLWLIKWEGYPAEVASWTPADELSDPAKLIESFELTAKTEGVALSYSSPLSLLHEAVDAGWGVKEI